MIGRSRERLLSFAGAAGAVALAGVLMRACPGSCTSCSTCATAVLPTGVSAIAVGFAIAGSAGVRSRRRGEMGGRSREGERTKQETI